MAERVRVARHWQSGTTSDLTCAEDLLCASFPRYIFLMTLFIFGCTGSSLLPAGFSLVAESRCYSLVAWASHCSGFFCCKAGDLGTRDSVVAASGLSSCSSQALEHRLSSGGTWNLAALWRVGPSQTRDQTHVSCTGKPGKPKPLK